MIVGLEHGADVSGGTIVTGAAMGDLSGYTLTLTGMETKPANFVAHTTSTDLIRLCWINCNCNCNSRY